VNPSLASGRLHYFVCQTKKKKEGNIPDRRRKDRDLAVILILALLCQGRGKKEKDIEGVTPTSLHVGNKRGKKEVTCWRGEREGLHSLGLKIIWIVAGLKRGGGCQAASLLAFIITRGGGEKEGSAF